MKYRIYYPITDHGEFLSDFLHRYKFKHSYSGCVRKNNTYCHAYTISTNNTEDLSFIKLQKPKTIISDEIFHSNTI